MSLKAFHLVFIVVCTVFAGGLAAWGIRDWRGTGDTGSLTLGVGAVFGGLALIPYGFWFVRKLRNVSYL